MTLQAGVEVRFLARLPVIGYRLSVNGEAFLRVFLFKNSFNLNLDSDMVLVVKSGWGNRFD